MGLGMSKGTVYDWTQPREIEMRVSNDGRTVTPFVPMPSFTVTVYQMERLRSQPEFFRLLNLNMEQRTGDEPV